MSRVALSWNTFSILENDRCCFRIGLGSGNEPCCLKTIPCEEYDNLLEGYEDKEHLSGGTIGDHHYCPKDADEAANLIAGE